MGIKIRPMMDSDYSKIGSIVRSSSTSDGFDAMDDSLDSVEIFGERLSFNTTERSLSKDNKRGYIKLEAPTLNKVLSRNGTLLRKILNIQKKIFEKIDNNALIYVEGKGLVAADDVSAKDHYLYSGQFYMKLIDEFSIEDAIEEELLSLVGKAIMKNGGLKKKKEDDSEDIDEDSEFFDEDDEDENRIVSIADSKLELADFGKVSKDFDETSVYLVAGYYFTPGPEFAKYKSRTKDLSDIVPYLKNEYFSSYETRLTYLLNIRDKEVLYSFLNRYIAVMPSGTRPKIDTRTDPLTNAYAKIIKCNQELRLAASESQPKANVTTYRYLVNAVNELQKRDAKVSESQKKKYKCILDRLKGKHGQIRSVNLGRRQDYSGRSAVTINPFMSVDHAKVPEDLLPKLYEYHLLKYLDADIILHPNPHHKRIMLRTLKEKHILDTIPVIINRAPTLHKQSVQAFWVTPTKSRSIEMNPLICPGFNMDFDGDQAAMHVPCSPEAIEEAVGLILTTRNIFLAKSGECTIVPRMDIILGLYKCTRSYYEVGRVVKKYSDRMKVREDVIMHKIKVWDTIECDGQKMPAGYMAFLTCFPKDMNVSVQEITSKTIKKYVNKVIEYDNIKLFIDVTNSMVELGFKVAELYMRSVSLIRDEKPVPEYDNAMDEFNSEMEELEHLYDLGLEDDQSYSLAFDEAFQKVETKMKDHIIEKLGQDSGYVELAQSGARGNTGNLIQMFAYVGRIQKNSKESFNSVIEHSYVTQMTSMEHFIAAFGGRKGQIDKSIKTGDTGYTSRFMWHATQSQVINSDDCGTKEGILIRKSDIAQFTNDESEIDEIFKSFITGRYQAKTNKFIDSKMAEDMCANKNVVEIRSPIKCKNMCCKKCYGIDPSTHKMAIKGLPIGFIAAQSIGEPTAQLTMKQFQKGGIAGKGDVTSNFDKLSIYLAKSSIAKTPTYDPIAWETGRVTTIPSGTDNVYVCINEKKGIKISKNAVLKDYVEKGEGLSLKRGDHDLNEIERILGVEEAQTYLLHMLYNLFKDEVKIVSKHFETLIAAMTKNMIIDTDREDLLIGQYCTNKELYAGSLDHTDYVRRLISAKKVPKSSLQALESIAFEEVGNGLSRINLLTLGDNLESPMTRMILSLPLKLGTYYDEFLRERKEQV